LISKLLAYKPMDRIKANEALAHPFFDELREENLVYPNGNCLPNIFNFTSFELKETTPALYEATVPEWYIDYLEKNGGAINKALLYNPEKKEDGAP